MEQERIQTLRPFKSVGICVRQFCRNLLLLWQKVRFWPKSDVLVGLPDLCHWNRSWSRITVPVDFLSMFFLCFLPFGFSKNIQVSWYFPCAPDSFPSPMTLTRTNGLLKMNEFKYIIALLHFWNPSANLGSLISQGYRIILCLMIWFC